MLMALGLARCEGAASTSTLRLGLTTTMCVQFCASSISAELFLAGESLPFGPGRVAECGEALVFEALPAGEQVRAEVRVSNIFGETILTGSSELVTIVADGDIDIHVALTATVLPLVLDAAPDPVVVTDDPATVALSGSGFEPPAGRFGVFLDTTALETIGWSAGAVTVNLAPGQSGSAITVQRCGVSSVPYPLRVVARDAPGSTVIAQAPGCQGRLFVSAEADSPGTVIVAARCDDPSQGYLQRFGPDSGECAYLGGTAWTLGSNPTAAASNGTRIWVALADDARLAFVDADVPAYVALPIGTGAVDVAALDDGSAYAVTDTGKLITATMDAAALTPGVSETLEFTAVDALGDRVFAVAREGDAGKLVELIVGGGSAEYSLDGCAGPTHVAVSALAPWVAIACDEGRVLLYDPVEKQTLTWALPAGEAPDSMVLDDIGDVAIVGNDLGLHAVHFSEAEDARTLASWAVLPDARPLTAIGTSNRLLLSDNTGESLLVATPYDEAPLCEDGQ
ncbi:MAG: hypothetical protein ACI9MR_000889 [Myxococcota bacterium]|jgi:hypothetical protein